MCVLRTGYFPVLGYNWEPIFCVGLHILKMMIGNPYCKNHIHTLFKWWDRLPYERLIKKTETWSYLKKPTSGRNLLLLNHSFRHIIYYSYFVFIAVFLSE